MCFFAIIFLYLTRKSKMDRQERKAVISIEMDQVGNFEIRWDGDNQYRLPMMGALDF